MLTYALDALLQALRRGALSRLDIQFLIILALRLFNFVRLPVQL